MDYIMAHEQAVNLDWTHPGPNELSTAANFIQSEDKMKLDAPFAVSATFDPISGKFVSIPPYAHLERALRLMLRDHLGLEAPHQKDPKEWCTLCDKVLDTQKDFTERQQSAWRRIWHGVGKASENVDVWVGWIPSELGLAVVKTGLALVINLAGRSLEKRQKILRAFQGIQQAMASAGPGRASFRGHEDVTKASDSLYQSIVDSIEDLILLTTEDKSTWRRMVPKLEHRKKKTDIDTVLQQLSEKTEAFERAIGIARDEALQRVDHTAHYTAVRATLMHHDMTENHKRIHHQICRLEAESRRTAQQRAELSDQNFKKWLAVTEARERRLDEQIIAYKNEMMAVVLEASRSQAEHDRFLRKEYSHRVKRGPVIAPGDFWQLFAEHMIVEDGPDKRYVPDDEISINHPVVDLEYVLMCRGNMRARESSQTQTLLRHDRFITWMSQANPDLILVNANIQPAGQGKVSAMSILCADLVGCLAMARPQDVIIQFFCGLHSDYEEELFPGPSGLVRSLILQVFLKLVSFDQLNLDFLHDRRMVDELRAPNNLEAMCYTLHELLRGFPGGTRVFCIIDSISMIDTFDSFQDLEVVLQCLRDIVEDRGLRAFFKVLMANNSTCSMDLQTLPVFEERPDRIVNLSSGGLMPGGLGTRAMRRHISRSSSPSFSMANLGRMGGRPRSYHEYDE